MSVHRLRRAPQRSLPRPAAAPIALPGVTLLQLNPPLSMDTPDGVGLAHILADYGPHAELCWTVVLAGSGLIRTYSASQLDGRDRRPGDGLAA